MPEELPGEAGGTAGITARLNVPVEPCGFGVCSLLRGTRPVTSGERALFFCTGRTVCECDTEVSLSIEVV